MAYLKAYEWEHKLYPRHQRIKIPFYMRDHVAREVARVCEVKLRSVSLNLRHSGGHAWSYDISLPGPAHTVGLGVIIHEIAHLRDSQKFQGRGHTGTFKGCLTLCYSVVNQHMKQVLTRAKQAADAERARINQSHARIREKLMREATRKASVKERKNSREYKMEALRKREKRLASRIKRLTTMVASVRRSLRAYERAESRDAVKDAVKSINVMAQEVK